MSEIKLETDNGIYTGWENITISRSLEQMANTFSLGVTEKNAASLHAQPIHLDSACRVLYGGKPLISGTVEDTDPSYSDDSHTITLSGRDSTADLIDCSAIIDSQELSNVNIKTAAEILCKPYNIPVNCPAPGPVFKKFAINDGETVFTCLEQYARQRGLLLYTLGDGVLHIGKPDTQPLDVVLKEGDNILEGSAKHSNKARYHRYIVKSQAQGGKHAVQAEYIDSEIRNTRTLILRAERAGEDCAKRAEWEARVRRARGRTANIKFKGWEHSKGKVWDVGDRVFLESERLGFQEYMIISHVTLTADDNGKLSDLVLTDPEAYTHAGD